MCGIAGIIGADPEAHIGAMLKAIEHRGRDDEGVWTSTSGAGEWHVSLGNRRLSIIDTSSAGHQPMISDDGRYVLVLNGEIYNYGELREQLFAKGYTFRTQSDTEVLLTAWIEWEEECLQRINGMFAFAIWDDRQRTLFLVRDHVGIKPLYYSECQKPDREGGQRWFLFASEIKSILATRLVKSELDVESLHQFLTFLWAPDPNTLFKGVRTVPPGHLLTWRQGETKLRQ